MPPIQLNRRKFLGCSAAAGLALSQGIASEASASSGTAGQPVRIGLIGAGNRGTALLRALLESPTASITSVCDSEEKHLNRALGIAEKAQGKRPAGFEDYRKLLERTDVDAVVVALPCDRHAEVYVSAIEAGKHLYAEKPLAPTIEECDRVIASANRRSDLAVRVGFQRRSHPRYIETAKLAHRGELGTLIEGRATWSSSNGPVSGHNDWLARRERSGDWMVEQAVHVWDVYRWMADAPPIRAFGSGRRDLFSQIQPHRNVTDHYSAMLEWESGFRVSFTHSWGDPADDAFTGVSLKLLGTEGGADFASGTVRFRDRSRPRRTLHPGNLPDTRFALEEFLQASLRPDAAGPSPSTLAEARDATRIGLMVRKAIDEKRIVTLDEIV